MPRMNVRECLSDTIGCPGKAKEQLLVYGCEVGWERTYGLKAAMNSIDSRLKLGQRGNVQSQGPPPQKAFDLTDAFRERANVHLGNQWCRHTCRGRWCG